MARLIWLTEERTFGDLIAEGPHMSLVRFNADGMEYETYVERDEYEIMDGHELDNE